MSLRHSLVAVFSALTFLGGCGESAPDPVAATLRLDVANCQESAHQRATAVRLADDLAVTVAHAFLIDGEPSVADFEVFSSDGLPMAADLVFLDPETDVALLRLTEPGPSLTLASYDEDASARFVTFASPDGPVIIRTIEITRMVEVTLDGDGARQALELDGVVAPGDSGSPVLDDDGDVLGIVFAASKTDDVGWAVASFEIEAAISELAASGADATEAIGCS